MNQSIDGPVPQLRAKQREGAQTAGGDSKAQIGETHDVCMRYVEHICIVVRDTGTSIKGWRTMPANGAANYGQAQQRMMQ
jgi:hypothetical protein